MLRLQKKQLPSWRYVPGESFRSFVTKDVIEYAGSLTFKTILAIFPALIVIVAILGILGNNEQVASRIIEEAESVTPETAWTSVGPIFDSILRSQGRGLGMGLGIAVLLWTVAGYIRTFGHAMNRIYGVGEGRGILEWNIKMYFLTLALLVTAVVGILAFGMFGPVAAYFAGKLGITQWMLSTWGAVRWAVVISSLTIFISMLYRTTSNVKLPKSRILGLGALLSVAGIVLSTLAISYYFGKFGNLGATYGALSGVIVVMIWAYISNVLILAGAVIDCEVMRVRQLWHGMEAEDGVVVELRNVKGLDSLKSKADLSRKRYLRVKNAADGRLLE
ncbi:YihY/virulence factor BrkB family protein [Corynebacteriaceae bacterium 7-707]